MSIAAKCICGSSLNGICNFSNDCPQLVNMEKKYPIESDAWPTPLSFYEMVGLIKNLHTHYLEDVLKANPDQIEKSWEQYKTLNHLYRDEQALTGAVWVKATARLPGYTTPVQWRDGNDHSHATSGKIPLIDMAKPFLVNWEWLDESKSTQI